MVFAAGEVKERIIEELLFEMGFGNTALDVG
jgi:hypothetical protein